MVGLDWLDLDFFFITFFRGRSQNLSSAQKCAPGGLGAAAAAAAAAAASQKGPRASQKRPRALMGPLGPHRAPWGPMGPYGALWAHGAAAGMPRGLQRDPKTHKGQSPPAPPPTILQRT